MPKNANAKSIDELCRGASEWQNRLHERNSSGKVVIAKDTTAAAKAKAVDKLTDQLAATSISGQAAKGSSGKRPSVSISIGEVDLDSDHELVAFGKDIEFATSVLEFDTMGDSGDLEEARKSLKELSEKQKAVSKFVRDNKQYNNYHVVSFSALTKKHIAGMGVTSMDLDEDCLDRLLQLFATFSPNSKAFPQGDVAKIFERFWLNLTNDGRYINDFKILKNNVGKKPEARARMLTDYILTQLMVFVHEHLKLVQLMFVELLLSSASNPTEVCHGKTATLLTGSVDYAIMSSADARTRLARTLGATRVDDVDKAIRKLSTGNSLDTLMGEKIWPVLKDANHFKFTIIEEKRINLGTKLKDCKPQVTGEALVLQSKMEQDSVPWCLSNGEDWIFGALKDRNSRSLPAMSIRDNDLKGSIKAILKMLILWTLCPLEAFKSLLSLK